MSDSVAKKTVAEAVDDIAGMASKDVINKI